MEQERRLQLEELVRQMACHPEQFTVQDENGDRKPLEPWVGPALLDLLDDSVVAEKAELLDWLEERHWDVIFNPKLFGKPGWAVGNFETHDEISCAPSLVEAIRIAKAKEKEKKPEPEKRAGYAN